MDTVFRAAAAYLILLMMLRITGRRTGKRLTTFEILVIFLLGGQMTQAILGDDRSLTNAIIGVSTVVVLHAAIAFWKLRWPALAKTVDGTPVIIYADGNWIEDRMRMLRIGKEDVLASLREDSMSKMEKVRFAIVERNGAISIIPKEES